MDHRELVLLFLLSTPGVAWALPRGCSALAAAEKELWVIEAGQAPRHVLSAESPIGAGSWSPDGRQIAFSPRPASTSVATEVVFADASGRILGRFKVDKSQNEGGLRYIDGIEWRKPRILVTMGNQGPHGGYLDILHLAKDLKGAERVRRSLILSGSWAISPSMQYVACVEDATIAVYDTLGPADEDGVVDGNPVFETPGSGGGEDDPAEGVESNLAWDPAGLTLYAVQSLHSRRVLTSVETSSETSGAWKITDRDLVGVDSAVRHVEVDVDGRLLLSDEQLLPSTEHRTYRVDVDAARSPVVARVTSPAALRRPGVLEVTRDDQKLTLQILDTHCEPQNPR